MTVPVPYAWVDDETATADLLNTNVRDPQLWLLGLPTFSGTANTTATALSNGVWTVIPMETEWRKVKFTHAANDSKVYAQEPGWYRYIISGYFNQTTYGNTDNRGTRLLKNGTDSAGPGGAYTSHSDAATRDNWVGCRGGFVYLAAGDYVQLSIVQTSPSTDCTGKGTLTLLWQGRDA